MIQPTRCFPFLTLAETGALRLAFEGFGGDVPSMVQGGIAVRLHIYRSTVGDCDAGRPRSLDRNTSKVRSL